MTAKQKKMLTRIIVAAALLIALAFAPVTGPLRLILYLVPYLLVGYDILIKAAKGIRNGRIFDENFLMAVATLGAIAIALYDKTGDYTEAVAVMLFYQIGEWFQAYAVGKSRRNISELMDIRPDYANIERNGTLERVDPEAVETGSVIVVQPGEKVPIDGVVLQRKLESQHECAHRGKRAEKRRCGRRDHERLHQSYGRTPYQNDQALRRLNGLANFGTRRERVLPQVQVRSVHHAVCPRLYADRLLRRTCACRRAAACAALGHGT